MSSNTRKRRQTHPTTTETFSTHYGHDVEFDQDNKSSSSQSYASDKLNTGKFEDSNSQKTIGSGYGTGLVDYRKNGKVISTSRITFFTTFGISAVVAAILAYYFLRASESAQFEKQVSDCGHDFVPYDLFWVQFFISNIHLNVSMNIMSWFAWLCDVSREI